MSKLTVVEIADMCECSRRIVTRWIQKGYLKAEKDGSRVGRHGGSYVVDEKDLRNFLLSDQYTGHPESIMNSRCFNRTAFVEECYPMNLLISVLSIPIESENDTPDIWSYDIRNFKKLITTLTDREQRILQLRYQYGLTLDETGKIFDLTRERIRSIQVHAERKLRHRSATGGVKLIDREKYDELKIENNVLKARIVELESKLEQTGSREEEKKPTDIAIEELNWSIRAYNCLKRAGFNTFGDILYFDQHQGDVCDRFPYKSWWHIRNLGKTSLREVAKVVFEFCGYRIQNWNERDGYVGPIPIEQNEELCKLPIYTGKE